MLKKIVIVLCALFSIALALPQFGYGGYGGGYNGGFGEQGASGGSLDLGGQGSYDNSHYGPFGGGQSQGEFSGNLQATGFDNQGAGGFGAGGFNGGGGIF